jgi:hypothetical protein
MITLIDALNELGVSAYCKNNDYDTIVWTNPEEAVSKKALNAKVAEMQKAEDAIQYQKDRLAEYPSIQELVVALYDADDKAEIDKKRAEIKKKYPKP